MTRLLLAGFALALTFACSSDPVASPDGWQAFGAGVSDGEAIDAAALLVHADQLDGTTVIMEAPVAEVCPKKGCWMTFEAGGSQLRVTFKDYDFFVPMDIQGRTVKVEGVFEKAVIPLAEAQHYLEDEGLEDEAAALTGDQDGYKFVASGVLLKNDA